MEQAELGHDWRCNEAAAPGVWVQGRALHGVCTSPSAHKHGTPHGRCVDTEQIQALSFLGRMSDG